MSLECLKGANLVWTRLDAVQFISDWWESLCRRYAAGMKPGAHQIHDAVLKFVTVQMYACPPQHVGVISCHQARFAPPVPHRLPERQR